MKIKYSLSGDDHGGSVQRINRLRKKLLVLLLATPFCGAWAHAAELPPSDVLADSITTAGVLAASASDMALDAGAVNTPALDNASLDAAMLGTSLLSTSTLDSATMDMAALDTTSVLADADKTEALQAAVTEPKKKWLFQSIGLYTSIQDRFGPYRINQTYLEYDYAGRTGPFDLFGYMNIPKVLDVGSRKSRGAWDGGSPFFSEQKPRMALDTLMGKDLKLGPLHHVYLAADWIYDHGPNSERRQNTLYIGLGTDIDTGSKLMLKANFYARRQFENYGAANEFSWDGYRYSMVYRYPLGRHLGGDFIYFGYFDYTFDSKLGDLAAKGTRSNKSFVSTNAFIYNRGHLQLKWLLRYFYKGGQWNDAMMNFGEGPFRNHATGWSNYVSIGYRW